MVLSGLLGEQFLQSLLWMLGLWTLCVLDLVALAKTIAAGIILMSDQAPEKKSALAVQALSWGSLKMIFLGVIGLVLWKASTVPTVALLSGIGTLLIVPLVGGFWWSQKELSHA
ncbi:MAG: hypothetical protein H7222_14725 [Methylotenera sp.]|nr:hypothetical protein [Oligoflexia bacterium]